MTTPHFQPNIDDALELDDDIASITQTPEVITSQNPITLCIPADLSGSRLDSALAAIIPELSRSKITNWIKAEQILVNNKVAKPKDKVFGNETVQITPILTDENEHSQPENIPLNIIYEDEHLIVINKPAGFVVHPGNGNWHGTLLNAILYHHTDAQYLPRGGIIHRLDKDTSGLMVIAKTQLAQTNLVEQLQTHSVSRIYRAIVHGRPLAAGCIDKNIGRDSHNRIKMAALEHGGRNAITHYRVLEYFMDFSYIECRLETGRTHQIRVHLKSIGYPLMADPLYGKPRINYPGILHAAVAQLSRQALHAHMLSFIHPKTQQLVEFSCEIPNDIQTILEILQHAPFK